MTESGRQTAGPVIWLFLTPEVMGGAALADFAIKARSALLRLRILPPVTPGKPPARRLLLAAFAKGHKDALRAQRALEDDDDLAIAARDFWSELAQEIRAVSPERLLLFAPHMLEKLTESEIRDLITRLEALGREVRIVLHVEPQEQVILRLYADQILNDGRSTPLTHEIAALNAAKTFPPRRAALKTAPALASWLDYASALKPWQASGAHILLRTGPGPSPAADFALREVCDLLNLPPPADLTTRDATSPPSAEWLARARVLNEAISADPDLAPRIGRPMWRRLMRRIQIAGTPLDPGVLAPFRALFQAGNAALAAAYPSIAPVFAAPVPPATEFAEPEFTKGFDPERAVEAFAAKLKSREQNAVSGEDGLGREEDTAGRASEGTDVSGKVRHFLKELLRSPYAPHNHLGEADAAEIGAPFVAPTRIRPDNQRRVIVTCMKNEGPYIIEWIAYHRMIGVDDFLVFTNGCTDGTDAILQRLEAMGLARHRNNDDWKGKSPQQAALNRAMKDDVLTTSSWIIHTDVDEFINIKAGNGTLDDLIAAAPGATAFALTWRIFGHDGVLRFADEPVIAQFSRASPKFCPKPHTVWGFKTMLKNQGDYEKLSVHRPNKLTDGGKNRVVWVNGSGLPMGEAVKERGWRSSTNNVGFDLVQLNHYTLRSAESFMIKRDRGRALHVDRDIGANYWIRNDWSYFPDLSIQRNLPRLKAEIARLLQDKELARLHADSVAWHQQRIATLLQQESFSALYQRITSLKMEPLERAAYSLALDLES